ncbi:MAG: hypothetical protein Q9170_002395 [Blastenia crenularia]
MIQPIPDRMSFEVAAFIQAAHVTAYHALVDAARLAKGEAILIHSAAGVLAKHLQAEIFVTTSSEVKKDLVMNKDGIAKDQIFNSRDLTFVDDIMRMTGGRNIDIVLNSLAGEAFGQTRHCLAWFGRFVEMGKKRYCWRYYILRDSVPMAAMIFGQTIDLLRSGAVKPMDPISVMPLSRNEEVFRLMQSGRHTRSAKPEAQKTLAKPTKAGIHAVAYSCAVADSNQVKAAIAKCQEEFPPIRDAIQGAMALKGPIFQNMTHQQWEGCLKP